MAKYDVITFGSAVIDAFVNTELPEKNGRISYPVGSKILVKELDFQIGGSGINTAVAFSRLGLKTGYIGYLGNDENAKKVKENLEEEKVSFLGKQEEGEKTGFSVVLDSKEHNRTILTYKGISNKLKFSDVEKNVKKIKTSWLFLTSLLEESFETQWKVAKYLKEKKKPSKVAFNPDEYLIKKKSSKVLKDKLKLTDLLVLNKEEANLLLKKLGRFKKVTKKEKKHEFDSNGVAKKDFLAKNLANYGPNIVVITDKDKEVISYEFEKDKIYKIKPSNAKAKERTGAGDAFASGFVAGQIAEKTINESLKLGLKEAESVIKYFGATNKLLERDLKKEG